MGEMVSGTHHCTCKATGIGLMLQELVLGTVMLGSGISFVPGPNHPWK